MSSKRRKGREVALKVLYQVDLVGADPQEAFLQVFQDEILRVPLSSFAVEFLNSHKTGRLAQDEVAGYVDSFVNEVLPHRQEPDFAEYLIGKAGLFCTNPEIFAQKFTEKIAGFGAIETFARQLVDSTIDHLANINGIIKKFADHWSMDRMASLDRVIIRFAITELLYFTDIPVNVTINEAVELSKKFSTERSREFVNGILDKVQREYKPEKNDPRQKKNEQSADSEANNS